MRKHRLSRRTVLRGLGTALSLPWLEAMTTSRALATVHNHNAPVRLAFLFVPNGAIMEKWTPTGDETNFTLPSTLEPLEKFKKELLVISGLAHDKARANGDGPGDHARSSASYLTGSQPYKTAGRDIRAGVSVDQLAAEYLGAETRLPSLELGIERGAQAGNCDSGYSCAYSSNISWKTPSQPMPKEVDPRAVFTRLFGDPTQADSKQKQAREAAFRRSVLDIVAQDARDLRRALGQSDQIKVDEYLDSVRSIEKRLQHAEQTNKTELPPGTVPPDGIPTELQEHIHLVLDMLVLAFQTDSTRVSTFMFANEGSNRPFPFLGVRNGHHELSHHGYNPEKMELISRIDRFYVEQLAYFLDRLRSIREGEGTLLDHTLVLYGSAIADGHKHAHDDLPAVLAGNAHGILTTGRHVTYPRNTPMCNLYLNMLDFAGVAEQDRFGDSTGRLSGLTL